MLNHQERLRVVLIPLFTIVGAAVWLGATSDLPRAQVRKMPAKLVFDERFLTPDIVTVEARKKTNDLVRVPVHYESDRIRASELGTVAQDFGSFLLVYGSKRSLARRYGEGAQKVETTVHLPGAAFEPIASAPALSVNNSAATRFGRGYYVVQLAGIATDDVLDSIRALGLEVLQYVPNNAFFVYGDSSSAARASAHSRVRWVGEYAPDQKIAMHLQNMTTSPDGETAMYNISVFARADLEEVASKILEASGGRLVAKMPLQSSYFNVVRVEMQAGSIGKVAGLEDIVAIDSFEAPTIEDERSSQILAGNYIDTTNIFAPGYDPLTQFGVTGTNVTVAVVDDGVSIPGSGGLYI